jgi:hypothetical protein
MTMHRHKPLCDSCRAAPAELKPSGSGWKKRCAGCQRAYELRADRDRSAAKVARRRLARLAEVRT